MKYKSKNILALLLVFSTLLSTAVVFSPVTVSAAVTTDTTSVPGWTLFNNNNVDGGAYVVSTESAVGNNSLFLYNNTVLNNGSYFMVGYTVSGVEAGKSYVYGFSIKAKKASNVTNHMNTEPGRKNLLPSGATGEWNDVEFIYNHTDSASTTAIMKIMLNTKAEGVWIDDVYFYEKGDPKKTNMVADPSFENATANISGASTGSNGIGRTLIPVSQCEEIVIDGDNSDWINIDAYPITKRTTYAGTLTIAADLQYAYDENNFYFLVEVEDEVHEPILSGQYWMGDGIQFTICGIEDTFGKGYAFSYDPLTGADHVEASEQIKCVFKREGNISTYEVAIPWTDYFEDGMQDSALFCLIVNDNDDDGNGRKGCLEVSAGIADTKNSKTYPLLMMIGNDSFASVFSGTGKTSSGEEASYYVNLFNPSDKDKEVTVSSETLNVNQKVTIPADGEYEYEIVYTFSEPGEYVVDVAVSDGVTQKSHSVQTKVNVTAEQATEIIERHKANYAELTPLMEECRERGIPLDYEEIDYNILGYFVGSIEQDLARNTFDTVLHQDAALTDIYERTKETLNAYLAGTKEPVAVPTYVTSDIKMVNKHFEALTDTDGVIEERPVFFVGAGHWADSRKNMNILSSFGFNAIQPELGPYDFMYKNSGIPNWAENSINGYVSTTAIDTSDKRNGDRSLKITATGEHKNNSYWYIQQSIEVTPNTTYEYGLSAKSQPAQFTWFTVDKTKAMENRIWINGTYDWRDYNREFTTGPDETSILFMIFNEEKGNFNIDDVYLRVKGSTENLVKNGDFEMPASESYWSIDERAVESLANDFDLMAENNLSGALSMAPHYVPGLYLRDFPEIASDINHFNNTILDHPKTKELMENYVGALFPRIKDKEAFDSVIIRNEPTFTTKNTQDYYVAMFRADMEEKYTTIEALNEKWGTEYTDFSEITMPTFEEPTPRFYDWRVWNDEVLPRYHAWMREVIKGYAPDVPTQTKIMCVITTTKFRGAMLSNNWARLAPTVDLNGCDGWVYLDDLVSDLTAQHIWYDMMTSFKNAPVYNTEEHIIRDGTEMVYSDMEHALNVATMWQGAIHGRAGSIVWLWDRDPTSMSGGKIYNSFLQERPDTVAALGKICMDLNRLSREIVAIQDAQPQVGMLTSYTSEPYAADMMHVMYGAYAAMGENGAKTLMVDESDIGAMRGLSAFILPHTPCVTDEVFEEIEKFAENGGKILVFGENSLSMNEYGEKRDADRVSALIGKCNVVKLSDTIIRDQIIDKCSEAVSELVSNGGYSPFTVIDQATGKPLENCEFLYAEYDGDYILNLCNYNQNDVNVKIYLNGKEVTASEELISRKTQGSTISMKEYEPMLLRIKKK